jgi:LemA protein
MKIGNLVLIAMLTAPSLGMLGCDVKQHMEDVGFKQGDSVVEKGTIKYDTLVDKDETCNEKWADYQSQIQRRNDMIPQLVGVVKGAAAHEEVTLIAVTQARAAATRPEIQMQEARHNPDGSVTNDFENPDKLAAYQAAQASLSTSLVALRDRAQEAYPQLAANQGYHDLQVQIEGTENRILRSREEFNSSVKDFNGELRHVSGKVINPITGFEFKPRQYFSADQGANVAPTVDFGTPVGATAVQPAKPVPQVK